MKRGIRLVLALVAGALAIFASLPAAARDYGQQGAVFAISEPDFLKVIENRLKTLEASGELAQMNQALVRRTRARVNRPDPVAGIVPASRARSWTFDPAMVVEHDIRDLKGNLIARAGQRVNPLDTISVPQALVFIDGDDETQMAWALRSYSASEAKIIMVNGAPLEAMTRYQRRFYFDQAGSLVERFGIRAVPAVAEQQGTIMRLREVVLPRAKQPGT